jgi:hypothetical protein
MTTETTHVDHPALETQKEICRHMSQAIPDGACDVCCPEMFPPRAEVERQLLVLALRRRRREGGI